MCTACTYAHRLQYSNVLLQVTLPVCCSTRQSCAACACVSFAKHAQLFYRHSHSLITSGLQCTVCAGVYLTMRALLRPGDKVVTTYPGKAATLATACRLRVLLLCRVRFQLPYTLFAWRMPLQPLWATMYAVCSPLALLHNKQTPPPRCMKVPCNFRVATNALFWPSPAVNISVAQLCASQ
jgi:hypothetical protein